MIGPVFVDTNVLVYWQDTSDPVKQSRAGDWIALLSRHRSARTSFQVLQEFYSVLTRKLADFTPTEVQEIVRGVALWRAAAPDMTTLDRAWFLQQRYALSWWDALIVAAAQSCECSVLLTEDLQHGQRLGDVRVIDPFRSPERTPAGVLEAMER